MLEISYSGVVACAHIVVGITPNIKTKLEYSEHRSRQYISFSKF
jgi:hypothetical protein